MHEELRPLMFSIAYRMVGGVAEAEDIVQEAYLRLHEATAEGTNVESPKAYLTTVTTRLAIDHLRSARVRREQYFGPWMPEPLISDAEPDPSERAEVADSLSIAFIVLLETLAPTERAVFLLREVFEYPYDEIAEIVDRSEENCRQIALRARRRIEEGKPRFEASREARAELADRFFAALEDGDVDELLELLAGDVVFVGDGGDKGTGVPQPIYGQARVARLMRAFSTRAGRLRLSLERAVVNGQPGAIVRDPDGRVVNVVALDVADGAVAAVRSIVNPDKLGHLGPVSDVAHARGRPQRD